MYFMDSDDWAEPTMLEDMYKLAKRDNAQLVVAGFYIDTYYDKENYVTDDYVVEDAVYPDQESFRRNAYKLFDKNLLYTPWNKLLNPDTSWKTIFGFRKHSGMISRLMSAL